MKYHALVIDDSPDILDDVTDRLESLGHTCDCVECQEKARGLLVNNSYSYVLLDLEIPLRYGKPSRIANGQNLLKEIQSTSGFEDIPIIVMTSHGHDSPDLAVEVMCGNGAIDYVKKPFPDNGRTLEKAIEGALHSSGRSRPGAAKRSEPRREEPPQPFEEGEMVFYPTHVDLCEIKMCGAAGNSVIRGILDELKQKDHRGKRVRFSAEDLADRIGCERGQNAVIEAVRDFRNSASKALLEEGPIQIDRLHDIILNDRRYGYRLSKRITVRDADVPTIEPANEPDDPDGGPANDPDTASLNTRQVWAMGQLEDGCRLQIGMIVSQFRCHRSTAKRDLSSLKAKRLIEFVGAAKTGHYRLKRSDQADSCSI